MTLFLILCIVPGIIGPFMLWCAGKCRGKNARDFCRLFGWGFLLLYLWFAAPLIHLPLLNYLIVLAPSALCFMFAVNAMIREMRAQKNGEFTEAA